MKRTENEVMLPLASDSGNTTRLLRALTAAIGIACFVIGTRVLALAGVQYIWDDAYMFIRYADNVLRFGRVAWNPGAAPAYGLTSPLYLSVVVPLHALIANPAVAIQWASIICGTLFLVLLALLIARNLPCGPLLKAVAILIVFLSIARMGTDGVHHFASGMDTMFALSFLTAYFLAARAQERAGSERGALLLGLLGGLAYAIRPDLMLYTTLVPAGAWLFAADRPARRRATLTLLATAGLLALQLLLFRWYFGSALPLPFYAKGTKLYGGTIYAQYSFLSLNQLYLYVTSHWTLFLLIGASLAADWRGRLRALTPVDRGMAVATVLFIGYYLFFVLQIMPYDQRFYYPTFPAIAFLAAQSLGFLLQRVPADLRQGLRQTAEGLSRPLAFLLVAALLPLAASAFYNAALATPQRYWSVRQGYLTRFSQNWYRLDAFSDLPDDLVIATTEVGNPGIMNLHKTVLDLAGLNETEIAHNGFQAAAFFARYKPDLIYMPHPHYAEMIREIEANPVFRAEYDYYTADQLGASMGVAIWHGSRHYAELKQIMAPGG